MIIRRWVNAFVVSVFVWTLLIGFADLAAGRGRQGSPPRARFGSYGHYHHHGYYGYYPFWRSHYYGYPYYYGYPFWFDYDEPYVVGGYYWTLNFRLPAFFHYPGAVGKGEITPQNPDAKPASQGSPQR